MKIKNKLHSVGDIIHQDKILPSKILHQNNRFILELDLLGQMHTNKKTVKAGTISDEVLLFSDSLIEVSLVVRM